MALPKNFREGELIGARSGPLFRFLKEFFNTSKWTGFSRRWTMNGIGCRNETDGYTGLVIGHRGSGYQYSGEEQKLLAFTSGRCTDVQQLYGPNGWAEGDATDLGPYSMHGGGFRLFIYHFGVHASGTRLQFWDQAGVELYDSGTITVNLANVSIDIPSGTTSITGKVTGTAAGAIVDLQTAYKIAA